MLLLVYSITSSIFLNIINLNILYIIIFTTLVFFLGFIDDRNTINANLRLFIFFLIFLVSSEVNKNFQMTELIFESLEIKINLGIFSSIFTAFCITAFINSINLIDGINSLANLVLLIIILAIFFVFRNEETLFINLIFFLFLNSYFIFKGKYFLGDSGSLGLSTFVGFYIIYIYNNNITSINLNFYVEDIFILMAFPGLDMLRVFSERIINKKNPFEAGRNHLHHYLMNKYDLSKTLFLYISFMSIPIIMNFIIGIYASYNLIFSIIFYFILLKIATKN